MRAWSSLSRAALSGLALMMQPGCLLAVGDGLCNPGSGITDEVTLNQRTEGQQILRGPRSLAALPNGGGLIAFASGDDPTLPSEVRLVRVEPDGARSPTTCDDDRETTMWPLEGAPTEVLSGIALSAPTTAEDSVALVWTSVGTDTEPARVRLTQLDPQTGCARPGPGLELAVDPVARSFTSPTVVRTRADQALVLFTDGSDTALFGRAVLFVGGSAPRFLPLRDALGAPTMDRPVQIPAFEAPPFRIAATMLGADRVAVAGLVFRGTRWEVHLAILDAEGGVLVPGFPVSETPAAISGEVDLDLAFDGQQLLVAWSLVAPDGAGALRGRFLTAAGDFLRVPDAPDGGSFALAEGEGLTPSVVAREGGGFFVAYTRRGALESRATLLLGFDASGARQFLRPVCDRGPLLLSRAGVLASRPSLGVLRDGAVMVAWTATEVGGVDADGTGIAARTFAPGALLP